MKEQHKEGTNYSYEMEAQRRSLERDFEDLGYPELSLLSRKLEGYDNLTFLAYTLYRLACDKNRLDIKDAMYLESWIYKD